MKRRVWKWVLGGFAAVALSIGGMLWSAQRRADAVFERQGRRVSEGIAAIRQQVHRRALLYPPAKPGDGWDFYEKALVGFEGIPSADADEIPEVNGLPDFIPDPELLEGLFEKHEPLVALLRESNRCSEFRPKYQYESGLSMNLPNVTSAMAAARMLAGRAAHFADSGRGAGALESIVLGLAVAQDTACGGPIVNRLVQIVCEGIEAETCRTLLSSHDFKGPDLAAFAEKLDRLAEARPDLMDAYAAEEACLVRTLVDTGESSGAANFSAGGFGDLRWGRSWRYLFSRRLACAGALGELERLFERTRALRGLELHLQPAAMDEIVREVGTSKNPIVRGMFPGISRVVHRDLVSRMTLTLLRVATAVAWYQAEKGTLPERLTDLVPNYLPRIPVCPLTGKPLGYRDGRVWSVGKNGIDDGGTPGKDDNVDDPDGDYVWSVKSAKRK